MIETNRFPPFIANIYIFRLSVWKRTLFGMKSSICTVKIWLRLPSGDNVHDFTDQSAKLAIILARCFVSTCNWCTSRDRIWLSGWWLTGRRTHSNVYKAGIRVRTLQESENCGTIVAIPVPCRDLTVKRSEKEYMAGRFVEINPHRRWIYVFRFLRVETLNG